MAEEGGIVSGEKLDDATRVLVVESDGGLIQAPLPDHTHLLPTIGDEFGPVRLTRELGRGAMAVVFLAHHHVLDREVAVKVLIAGSPASRGLGYARFAAEARTAAAVQDPHLTLIYHADLTGDVPYLVMEYVKGSTLAQLVKKVGRLSSAVTTAVMLQVSSAVGKLHDHDIIHRDLKLSNVLLDANGRTVVSDFGLAELHADSHAAATSELRLAGTPAYMAPEMFEGHVSARSDVYAMGVMMFHLLAGKVPFEGTLQEIRDQHQTSVLSLHILSANGATNGLLELIERAMDKDPVQRFTTGRELHKGLAELRCDVTTAEEELVRLIGAVD
jgi:serine/threonine-protein kinase